MHGPIPKLDYHKVKGLKNIYALLPRWSLLVLIVFVLVAILGKYLANDGSYAISPLIPYSESYMDGNNAGYVSPFEDQEVSSMYQRHWLGTDDLGRDVLSGIINGARIAFWVSLLSVGIALMIGIPFGLFAGYYGDSFKVGMVETCVMTILGFFLMYYLFYFSPSWWISISCIVAFKIMSFYVIDLLDRYYPGRSKWNFPVDRWMTQVLEIFKSVPVLIILILLLGTIAEPGIISISICLGVLVWVRIARYIRAEVLAIKESGFILAQKALGTSDVMIMFKHCLPKAIAPVMVSIIFLAASVILMEATLSFLGMGLSADRVSWGSMLNESRKYLGAWWMAVFPGISLFLVIAALANESNYWSQKMRIKIKD